MTRVRFIQPSGAVSETELGAGASVMLAAVRSGISGIDGECGGCLDCATCHVYVDDAQFNAIPAPGADELELLAAVAAKRKPNSRLSCQIKAPLPIETLTIHVPETQS